MDMKGVRLDQWTIFWQKQIKEAEDLMYNEDYRNTTIGNVLEVFVEWKKAEVEEHLCFLKEKHAKETKSKKQVSKTKDRAKA